MKSSVTYRRHSLHITIMVGMILLIGFKVASPVFKLTKVLNDITLTTEQDAHKTQNGMETDQYSKNNEDNITNPYDLGYLLWYTKITFSSQYSIDYKSSYYYKITIPPPELSLHTTA